MATTLTSPITKQNIVDRFADYVVATANAGIVWHSTNMPFPEFDSAKLGASTGLTIGITGASINAAPITASTIYNALVAETNRYTRIRKLHATLTITAPPASGNRTRLSTDALDLTDIASMSATYAQSIGSPANGGVANGQAISVVNLQTFFGNLQTAYNTARATSVLVDVSVCHSSCHASCHSSRGRR